jgi:hypothetical protein
MWIVLPGTQGPRGFYLVKFKLNYSLALESEKDTRSPTGKLASWLTSLSAVLQKLVLRSAWLCVLAKPAEAAGIPLCPPHLHR